MYTPREKAEMVLLRASGMSHRATADEYYQRHPGQPRPSHHLIGDLLARFTENGSVQDKPRAGRPRSAIGLANSVTVTAKVAVSPNAPYVKSRRKVLSVEVLSTGYFSGTNSTHTKHIVPELHGNDTDRRLEFCEWFSQTREQQNTLEADIVFSDEPCFHLNGTVNRHNLVYWSDENPHVAIDDHKQMDSRINVWCGIHGDAIVGPVFLDNKLTGVRYRQHLQNTSQPY
jgi:hypothetical protein